ncbi:MAG: hypothetical protein IKS66_07925 [Oscillospiraceae bacterium]|nr:hypothetical protein [Oscillospiraceae bacterium]
MYYPYSRGGASTFEVMLYIALALAVAATVAICLFILPKSKANHSNVYIAKAHDIVNFKSLLIDKLIKVLYIFSTCFTVLFAIFELFAGLPFLWFLILLIGGPILIRLLYESFMLFVLLTQNVIEINRKLGGSPAEPEVPAVPRMIFCTQCGTQFDASQGVCPNCGTKL